MKLTKNQKTGLIITGVAVAGFVAYRIFKKDPDEGLPADNTVIDNDAYLNKVKELQKLVGVSADGVIGPKTKAALAKYGYNADVNASNIDKALAAIRSKVKSVSTDSARYAKGLEIVTYLKNKPGTVKFISETTVNVYEKDVFGKFNKTAKTINFKIGNTFKPLYMINASASNSYGTGFKAGFMMFKIKRPLDFDYLLTSAPEFWIGPISSFSITVV